MTNLYREQVFLRASIKGALKAKGHCLKDLGPVLGLTTQQVYPLTRGERGWTEDQVAQVAEFLDTDVNTLIGDSTFVPMPPADRMARTSIVDDGDRMRALCCECGTLRTLPKYWSSGDDGVVFERDRRGRMLAPHKCATCRTVTRHAALLRGEGIDFSDNAQRQPSHDDLARIACNGLVARLRGFNIDVRYRVFGMPKTRKELGPPVVSINYDESKSQWCVGVNSAAYPSVQLESLRRAWAVIATDDRDFWEGLAGRARGACLFASDEQWSEAIEGLVDEVHRVAPAVLLQTAMQIADREESGPSEDR